jgi:hypothetical protein
MEDVYKIVFLGVLKQDIDSKTACEKLSNLFKVSPDIFERYLDGKRRVLKQDLSLDAAKKYQAVFNRLGAISEIDVVFNRRILETSSIFIEDWHSNAKQQPDMEALSTGGALADASIVDQRETKQNQDPVFVFQHASGLEFDAYSFMPPIYSSPGAVPVAEPGGAAIGTLESTRSVLGFALTLLAAVISAFVIQRLVLNFLLAKFGAAVFVTPVAISVFLMALVYLPKLLSLGKKLSVKATSSGEPKLVCRYRERKWGWPLTRTFIVLDKSKNPIACVKKNQFFLTYACTTLAGEVIYRANPDMDIEESVAYLGESVREELFSVAAFIFQGFEKVKSIANFLKRKNRGGDKKVIDIFNKQGAVVAFLEISKSRLKKPKILTLQVKGGASSGEDRRILLAFGLLLAGL